MPRRRAVLALTLGLVTTSALVACSGEEEQPRSDVGVQMFQWTWNAIATECTDRLGPDGFGWVLTSPPQEHIVGPEWWTSYQPVSYQVESRLGTREEFAAMVSTCQEAGVSVIADAVVNHMTGSDAGGTGWAGSEFQHYSYPGLYEESDFHHCGLTPNDDIVSYQDAAQVQTCELLNLADLDTGSESVQDTIRAYLEDLLSLGVAGFRIDAAKHIAADDVAAVLEGLPEDTVIMQEVIGAEGEPIQPASYTGNGQVFEFFTGRDLREAIRSESPEDFLTVGPERTGLTSEEAIVFVDNHDTERNGSTLAYRDGDRYRLGLVLQLASPYGTPVVLSGYAFDLLDPNPGPAQDDDGAVLDAACTSDVAGPWQPGEWVCQHRWPEVTGMLAWRQVAGDAEVTGVQAEEGVLALTRGDAVLLLNTTQDAREITYATGLPGGAYCDLLTGGVDLSGEGSRRCQGTDLVVDDDGAVTVALPGRSAIAVVAGVTAELQE